MKPVYMTHFGEGGDCLRAAIASILELELDQVPDFGAIYDATKDAAAGTWAVEFDNFLVRYGLEAVEIQVENLHGYRPKGYHLMSGKSPRGDFDHAVVGRAGKVVHDPHPEGSDGMVVTSYTVFVALLETGAP